MARLETQINQIYLTDPEAKKTSLVLYEESLSSTSTLYILAELHGVLKKTANLDLKRIAEIILESFRINKKLNSELLFEAALSQINQNLADLAHEGRKSWVGKFSCMVALRANSAIFLANTGPAAAWLKRGSELIEILPGEKRSDHPIKTFTNFTQGKLVENDSLMLTASNIFNYISAELLSKILNENGPDAACLEISRIIQDSVGAEQSFGAFILSFVKNAPAAAELEAPEPTYEMLPEEEPAYAAPSSRFKYLPALPSLAGFRLPRFSLPTRFPRVPRLELKFFRNLSRPGKFLFISFAIFLTLFLVNLSIYGIKLRRDNAQDKLAALVGQFNQKMADSQSALIYKDDAQAMAKFNEALADFDRIKQMDGGQAKNLEEGLNSLKILVNKISVVQNPAVTTELKHQPVYITRDGSRFLLAGESSNSLSWYDTSVKDYFLLNSLKEKITGIASWSPAGVVIATPGEIHHINQDLKQFESIAPVADGHVASIKSSGSNLYALNKNGQVLRISFSKNKFSVQTVISGDFGQARDLGADKDIYVLFPDKLQKISGGSAQAFPFPPMSDAITNADRVFVAGNIYVLEANKKRVVVLNKNGVLLNQIYFPNSDRLTDFYVNEAARGMYLLDNNKLLQITF